MRNWMPEQRKQLNLTQQEVADQTSVTRQMIAAIESGDANPSVTVAKEIAAVLGCDWTLFFEEPDNPPRRRPDGNPSPNSLSKLYHERQAK